MTTKVQRQQSITRLISEGVVTSQPQLMRLLKQSGIAATQATVSRDLEDLGAVKVRTAKGETAYAIPEFEPERIAPLEQLRRVLSEWVADIQVSHPLVIVPMWLPQHWTARESKVLLARWREMTPCFV